MSNPLRRPLTRRALLPGLFAVAGLSVFALSAAGCQQQAANPGGGASASPEPGASPAAVAAADYPIPPAVEGPFKVALITPAPVSDGGWGTAADDGIKRIQKELGAEATPPVEGPGAAEVAGSIRNLAQAGNQVIFLHGSEYDEAASGLAADFPKVTFVVDGGRTEKPNMMPIDYKGGQASYLAGMLAGGMSKSGKVGAVGAAEIPIVKDAFASFEKGVKAANPKATVKVVFTGDENDTAKAKQTTQALFAEGVDVVLHNANAAGKGVAQAVEEKEGAMFLGANTPQDDLATAKNLGSFVLDVPGAYVAVAKMVKEGKGTGKTVSWDTGKAELLHYNPGFKGTIPAELKAKIEQAEKDIASGKIDTAPEQSAMARTAAK